MEYRISTYLSCGGYGSVYRAILSSGEEKALKMIECNGDNGLHPAVLNEIVNHMSCNHPNILKFDYIDIDVAESNKIYVKLFSELKGEPIDIYAQKNRLSSYQIDCIMAKIIDAIGSLHSSGRFHGDLTLKNVLIDDKAEPTIIDMGFCKREIDNVRFKPAEKARPDDYESIGESKYSGQKLDVWCIGVISFYLKHKFYPNTPIPQDYLTPFIESTFAEYDKRTSIATPHTCWDNSNYTSSVANDWTRSIDDALVITQNRHGGDTMMTLSIYNRIYKTNICSRKLMTISAGLIAGKMISNRDTLNMMKVAKIIGLDTNCIEINKTVVNICRILKYHFVTPEIKVDSDVSKLASLLSCIENMSNPITVRSIITTTALLKICRKDYYSDILSEILSRPDLSISDIIDDINTISKSSEDKIMFILNRFDLGFNDHTLFSEYIRYTISSPQLFYLKFNTA